MSLNFDELVLPAGSKRAITLLNDMDSKKFAQLSQRVLASMPAKDAHSIFSNEEKEMLLQALAINSSSDLSSVIVVLFDIWNQTAFKQLKLNQLQTSLKQLGFSEELMQTLVDIWSKLGQSLLDRLRDDSFSGTPQLLDVNWTLRMDLISRRSPKIRAPTAVLELVTDEGVKHVALARSELCELFQTLQDIQKNLDSLLQ